MLSNLSHNFYAWIAVAKGGNSNLIKKRKNKQGIKSLKIAMYHKFIVQIEKWNAMITKVIEDLL